MLSSKWSIEVIGVRSFGLLNMPLRLVQVHERKTMRKPSKPLQELVKELPPDLHAEVRDFVEFLLKRRGRKRGRKLRQDWAGALRDYRDQYTSLELQKKALEWRGD
jgi:hypothetical protein